MVIDRTKNISIYEFVQIHRLDARTVNAIKNIVGARALQDTDLKVSDLKDAIRTKGWKNCRMTGKKTATLLAELLGLPKILTEVEQNTRNAIEAVILTGEDRVQVERILNKIIDVGYTLRKNHNKNKNKNKNK